MALVDLPPQPIDDGPHPRAVVLVGNAGGGSDTLRRFLARAPRDCPDVFLVHEGRATASAERTVRTLGGALGLPIALATHGTRLVPGSVLVLPSGHSAGVVGATLTLVESTELEDELDALDRSGSDLARALGPRAALVVLAGSQDDGLAAAVEIARGGGAVLAAVTRGPHSGHLPQSVRRRCAGVTAAPVDDLWRVLDERLERLLGRGAPTAAPAAAGPDAATRPLVHYVERLLDGALARFRSDHLLRRAELRRAALGIERPDAYLARLQGSADERRALCDAVEITSRGLFDQPGGLQELSEVVLPRLHAELAPEVELRAWVPRCGLGHEAFTLAILLEEFAAGTGRDYRVFATERDRALLERAVAGRLEEAEVAGLPDRLRQRHLRRNGTHWELEGAVRRRILFSAHDVTADAPFPRLDLVFFRRSLLVLRPAYRKHALERIRFGLRPGGVLVLGEGEEPFGFGAEFRSAGLRLSAFVHRPALTRQALGRGAAERLVAPDRAGSGPSGSGDPGSGSLGAGSLGVGSLGAGGLGAAAARPRESAGAATPPFDSLADRRARQVLSGLLVALGAAAVTLDEERRLQHVHGDLASFARIREGGLTDRLEALVEPEYRATLTRLLDEPGDGRREAVVHRVDGGVARLVVDVDRGRATVLFLPAPAGPGATDDEVAEQLRRELALMRDELLSTVRELEVKNEDLSAFNEELQSANEELHAVNEELQSVNEEYQRKIAEQTILTDDIENMLRNSEVGVLFLDDERCIRRATPAVAQVVPILPQDAGRPIADLDHHLEGVDLDELCAAVLLDGEPRQQVAQRARRVFLISLRPYSDHRGARTGVVVEFMEITALEETRAQLTRSEQQFHQLAENISEVFWIREVSSGAFRYLSPAFESVWKRSTEEALDDQHSWWRWVHDADRERARAELTEGLRECRYRSEYRVVRADGTERWIRDRGFPIDDADGVMRLMAGLAEDVTESKEQERELIAAAEALDGLANHDPLTGVLNRRGLERELQAERKRVARSGERLVAVLCDCDDFKRVNDVLGHAAGDVVLQSIARTIERTLRPSDHLARVGGDEFIALLTAARMAEALQVAERLRLAVAETTIRIGNEQLVQTASFGVAGLPADSVSVEEVVALCQQALGASKRLGKNRVSSTGGPGARQAGTRAADSADAVVEALLAGRGLEAYAQPLVRLTDGAVLGYELLVRGPEGPYRSPDALFALAMERNLLTLTDLACLQTCLRAARRTIRPDATLHVNLMPSTLLDLTAERIDELFPAELHPERICVEISEQQFIGEPDYLEGPVARLRERGISVGLDDVGFGRSSLETLVLLRPEVVKLDRSQVTGAADSPERVALLRRLTHVARNGCDEIIAEGVETEADERLLLELGIEVAQGFRLGRPHPLEADPSEPRVELRPVPRRSQGASEPARPSEDLTAT